MSVLKYNNNGTWEGLNIDHASTADSALYDGNGNVISSTYAKTTDLDLYLPLTAGASKPLTGNLNLNYKSAGAINFDIGSTAAATMSRDASNFYVCNLNSQGGAKNGLSASVSSTDENITETVLFSNGGYCVLRPNGPNSTTGQFVINGAGDASFNRQANFYHNGTFRGQTFAGSAGLYCCGIANSAIAAGMCGGDSTLYLYGNGSSGTIALRPRGNSDTTGQVTINSSGYIVSPSTYSHTTTTSANMVVGSGGDFYRSTSLRQYKTDINTVTKEDAEKGYELNPVSFVSAIEEDDKHTQYGFIAEEVNDVLPNLNTYDGDGSVAGVAYERICAILLKQNQMLKAQVDALEEEIKELKNI